MCPFKSTTKEVIFVQFRESQDFKVERKRIVESLINSNEGKELSHTPLFKALDCGPV